MREHANQLLHQALGPGAQFRDGQWEAIDALVRRRQRLLVVQRTGWGKSLVYFLATRLLRDQGYGPTVLISPLLALMRNQLRAAERLGLRAETLNSANYSEHARIEAGLLSGAVDLVLISPERLGNEHFQRDVWASLQSRVGLLVVDEVHCISDWGHDFRPDYRRIMPLLAALGETPVLGTTATANDRVVQDVAEILGRNVQVLRGPLTRSSLSLFADRTIRSAAWRLTHLAHLLQRMEGSGIIYCLTTRDCARVSDWLNTQGFATKPYFSGIEETTGFSRPELETELLENRVKALVASVALGMGFDKPDLGFVIHYQIPNSIVSYYQQIGRAGRAIDRAWVYLMRGPEDADIHEYFMTSAFPRVEDVRALLDVLTADGPQRYTDLLRAINVKRSTLDKILLHLELEGIAGEDDKGKIARTGGHLPDFARWERVTAQRRAELADMERYAAHEGCLMQYLAAALNDAQAPGPCGQCMNCRRWADAFQPTPEALAEAERFLMAGQSIPIEPRTKWMGKVPFAAKATLAHANQPGLALAYDGDEGWGQLVRSGKREQGAFDDALVEAAAALIEREWPDVLRQRPWVTNVPSRRQPRLVADVAERLAARLGLTYAEVVRCAADAPEQRTMRNSYQQLANVAATFIVQPLVEQGPFLLVDDFVDSGWTMTVIGYLLREAGAAAVYPFALAKLAGGG
jgi:ATP-dependent DNA helicase RecQ